MAIKKGDYVFDGRSHHFGRVIGVQAKAGTVTLQAETDKQPATVAMPIGSKWKASTAFLKLERDMPARKRNKTIITKPKRVVVLNPNRQEHSSGKPFFTKARAMLKAGETRSEVARYLRSVYRNVPAKTVMAWVDSLKAENPIRRKYRNGYLDLVIAGMAKRGSKGWRIGGKEIPFGQGIVPVKAGHFLDKKSGTIFQRVARNPPKASPKRTYNVVPFASSVLGAYARLKLERGGSVVAVKRWLIEQENVEPSLVHREVNRMVAEIQSAKSHLNPKNVAVGAYYGGAFHPYRSSDDYDESRVGHPTRKKAKRAAVRKAIRTVTDKVETRKRKATTSRLAGRSLSRSVPLKAGSKLRNPRYKADFIGRQGMVKIKRSRRSGKNPSPVANRRAFAGTYTGQKKLYFPDGTPEGLSKLGRLVLLKTQRGTIKPTRRNPADEIWLCQDQKGKLHIGATSTAPLYSGTAQDLGEVTRLEYQEAKPHLGYDDPVVWFHKLGEETGERPTLHSDGKGGLRFKGGAYTIEPRGIVN
ncbi:MAG: hypothetical protein KGJ13_05680 [Patescibacteria group bacterium]|nr:hypothetical protein [Patescibacteria group bacterium]